MLNHVLVPLDGSALSEKAIEHARHAIGPKGKISLLTVVEVPEYPEYIYLPTPMMTPPRDDYAITTENMLQQAREYLRNIAQGLIEAGVNVEIQAIIGTPAQVIIEVAEGLNVDAVVMSTHGRSGLSRWFYGSVTQKVLGATYCPVLVVPNREIPPRSERAGADVGLHSPTR